MGVVEGVRVFTQIKFRNLYNPNYDTGTPLQFR